MHLQISLFTENGNGKQRLQAGISVASSPINYILSKKWSKGFMNGVR